jgi:hypothetical protein
VANNGTSVSPLPHTSVTGSHKKEGSIRHPWLATSVIYGTGTDSISSMCAIVIINRTFNYWSLKDDDICFRRQIVNLGEVALSTQTGQQGRLFLKNAIIVTSFLAGLT